MECGPSFSLTLLMETWKMLILFFFSFKGPWAEGKCGDPLTLIHIPCNVLQTLYGARARSCAPAPWALPPAWCAGARPSTWAGPRRG